MISFFEGFCRSLFCRLLCPSYDVHLHGRTYRRRGYVNVVEPMGLIAETGEVVPLIQRARQDRIVLLAFPRFKYHLASSYRRAATGVASRDLVPDQS